MPEAHDFRKKSISKNREKRTLTTTKETKNTLLKRKIDFFLGFKRTVSLFGFKKPSKKWGGGVFPPKARDLSGPEVSVRRSELG